MEINYFFRAFHENGMQFVERHVFFSFREILARKAKYKS